ncbi:MAG: alcohol dehydrogenase [Deltaproteobacteria bacterium RBG_19FT_COMBO_52_11]|nr:MAG: alcohol dehydrogenase [Deltaproteobacteria bacterium RBG_19FT_COMBO_52_11]
MTQTYQFKAPSVIVNGPGAAKEAGSFAKGIGKKALIVTDRNLEKFGLLNDVKNSLEMAGIPFAGYNNVMNEPTMDHSAEGLNIYRETQADFLVAVGGGSPIDAAKSIAALANNPGKMSDFAGANRIPRPGAPLIAIPTTAGTGSEVTQFTIITDTTRDVKMLISSPHIMPRVALVDPLMTLAMPRSITAATGLDALTHAIEAYVSVKAQPITDTLALQAIRVIAGNLRQAWSNADNLEARTHMAIGALQAGLAFSNSSVALVHGMARPIGAYFHVPHGVSNAALLPLVIEFSIPGNPQRYAEIAGAMGEITGGLSVLDAAYLTAGAVERLNRDLKVPTLKELGVEEKKFNSVVEQMAADAIASGSPGNNPRQATQEEIVELYRKAFSKE